MTQQQLSLPVQASATQSYSDASSKLEEACAWLRTAGINFSANRVGHYRRIFVALANAQRVGKFDEFANHYGRQDFVNAVVERAQIVRIHDGLAQLQDPALINRLKQSMRGTALYVMDHDDRSGRDFSLELDILAGFARAGYQIDFNSAADIKASRAKLPDFVECKRLKSENSIPENIRKGLKQLKNRYKSATNPDECRGLLVLSIGKIINPNFGVLEGRTVDELANMCAQHVDYFANRHRHYWNHQGVDHRTLGVAIILDAPGQVGDSGPLYSMHEAAIDPILRGGSTPDRARLETMKTAFQPRQDLGG